jgi:pilus assembly protein CpaB
MNARSLMMLGMAMAFGLCAMFVTRQMMGQGTAKAQEDLQDVLVAARDVKEEEVLKVDLVKVIRMAKSAVPAGAYTAAKDVEERWAKTALLEGDVVIEKKLGPKGTPPGLVANIPKGMRAFAIDVTEQTGVSGFVLPGHRVDVIRIDTERAGARAESILQNIVVLAAGQVFTHAEERSLTTRTVTLAVSPEQVDVLVAARAKGSLSLSLRGVNDHEIVERPRPQAAPAESDQRLKLEAEHRKRLEHEVQELKAAMAARPAAPAPQDRAHARSVHIYRGIGKHVPVQMDGGVATESLANRAAPAPFPGVLDPSARPGTGLAPAAAVGKGAFPILEAAALSTAN